MSSYRCNSLDLWNAYFGSLDSALNTSYLGISSQVPRWDVVESDSAYTIKVDLPGIDKDTIDITTSHGILTFRAERKTELEKSFDSSEKYHFRERTQTTFKRSVKLPDNADENSIQASYKDGVLSIVITKIVPSEKKKISIKFE